MGKPDLGVAPRKCAGSRVVANPQLSGKTSDFFLFSKLKTTVKGRPFLTMEKIQDNAIRELRAFREAFQQRKKLWERCIASRGDYFEGNSA